MSVRYPVPQAARSRVGRSGIWNAPLTTASADVTLALTGVAATGQIGDLGDSVSYALTGNAATGSVGSLGDEVSYALTGVAATGGAGSIIPSTTYALTGNSATGAPGSVSSAPSYAISGVAATGNVGAVVPSITYALTGNEATGAVGTVSTGSDVTTALTGVAATGQVGTPGVSITYALTGVSAAGSAGSIAAAASYAIGGNAATGSVGSVEDAVAYALTGVQALGEVGTLVVPGDVTRALTGVSAIGQVGNLSASTEAAIPDVVGLSQADAIAALEAAGFVVSSSTSPSLHVAVGLVISQDPAAGSSAAAGSTVALLISNGSAALIGGGRRKNVPFRPIKRKRKEVESRLPIAKVEAKASGLLLGLMARGLATPTLPQPTLPEPAPALAVASIAPAVLVEVPPAAIEEPKPEVLPLTLDAVAQMMREHYAVLLAQLAHVTSELEQMRTAAAPPAPPTEIPMLRDPVNDAMHALLPTLRDPIDLDAVLEEPEERPPAKPAPAAPPKMTREQIDTENERRARLAVERLL